MIKTYFSSTDIKRDTQERFDMSSSRRFKLSQFVMLISLIVVNARSGDAESSGEYLQKVMIELQELNVPSNAATQDRMSTSLDYQHAGYQDDRSQDDTYRKLSINNAQQQPHQDVQKPIASLPAEYTDMAHSAANNIVQYYAVCRS